jgi:hypothetical protein
VWVVSLARSILVRGILGFGLIFGVLSVGWDWVAGTLTSWPQAAVRYPVLSVVGGVMWGVLMWAFERRRSTV